jgi:cbb3-type cytochrome oxidase subunit 3
MKSIADVVSASGLAFYAEVALAIFFLVFVAIGLRLLGHSQQWDHAARLPLEDDASTRPAHVRSSPTRHPPALP